LKSIHLVVAHESRFMVNTPHANKAFRPGTYPCQEVLFMSRVLAEMVQNYLCAHLAIRQHPEWAPLAERACDTLNELHNAIAKEHHA
jgi:hypothetical protein